MTHVPSVSAVGSMVYVIIFTQLDISHEVGVLRRYMSTPRKEHCTAVKRVFMYFLAHNIILYASKRNLKMKGKQLYMDLSMSTRLEILINKGRIMDMCSRCLMEQLAG